jgi:hypothetical protein
MSRVIPVTSRESWDAIDKLFLAGNTSVLGGFVPDHEQKKIQKILKFQQYSLPGRV